MAVTWDAAQYDRFADHRGRPFHELVARVVAARRGLPDPDRVVDLGCGPGSLTATLVKRWPAADVVGVDSSEEMLAKAAGTVVDGRPRFELGDIVTWRSTGPVDVIIANAAFQWVPDHIDLPPRLAADLTDGGVLAFQVPDNYDQPSHTLLRELRLSPRWRDRVGAGADRTTAVERPERYLEALVDAGLEPDVWQTEYLQVLPGDDAVLEWIKGTAMRPVLSVLIDPAERDEFLGELAPRLRAAYPHGPHGTVMPFRRTFAVGRRPR